MTHRTLPLALLTLLAAPSVLAADLRVTIRNALPQQGELMVALFNRAEGWPGSPAASQPAQRVKVDGETANLVFPGLPDGRWAVMVLQDLNGNGRPDTNMLGMPKEPYGASNNKLPRMSAPKFEEALVEVGPQGAAITIELRRP